MTTAATFSKPCRPTLVWLALSALTVGGCNIVDIEITSPAQGAEVVVGEPVTIEVGIAGERVPEVREVAFYRLVADSDAVLLGRDTRAPYQATWTPSAGDVGTVVLQAVATDTDGKNLGLTFSEVTVVAANDPPDPPRPTERAIGQLAGLGRISDTAFDAAHQIAVVVSSDTGLTSVDIHDPASPRSMGRLNLEYMEVGVATDGSYAYVSQIIVGPPHRGELAVVDLSSAGNPTVVGRLGFPAALTWENIVVQGDVVYLTTGSDLYLIDVSSPRNPTVLSSVAIEPSHDMAVTGGKVLLQTTDAVQVVDVSNPRNPRSLEQGYFGGNAGFDFVDGMLYRIDSASLWIYASPNPPNGSFIVRLRGLSPPDWNRPMDVAAFGGFAFVGTSSGVLRIDVSNPAAPYVVEEIATTTEAKRVEAKDGFVLASDSLGTLQVISLGQ